MKVEGDWGGLTARMRTLIVVAARACIAGLFALALSTDSARAHDLSVEEIPLPVSGCMLTSTEPVRLRIRNHGAPMPGASILSMSYTINGALPVSEVVFVGNPLQTNGTLNYQFSTSAADLSVPGTYVIDASVSLTGDSNPGNDAFIGKQVRNSAAAVAGSIAELPAATDNGVLIHSGATGDVVEWQQSIDTQRWRALENTTSTQAFSGLTRTTHFRVVVKSGDCAPATSNSVRVATDPLFRNGFEP